MKSIRINQKWNLLNCVLKCGQTVYETIYKAKDPVRSSELEKLVSYSKRSIRLAIQQLINLELVIKCPDLQDLRSYYLCLPPFIQQEKTIFKGIK